MYPEEICKPMREELTAAGVRELKTIQDVESLFEIKNKLRRIKKSVSPPSTT